MITLRHTAAQKHQTHVDGLELSGFSIRFFGMPIALRYTARRVSDLGWR
jgi:hypothetical protein